MHEAEMERFGRDFLRLVLHQERVLESIDRLLGGSFELGPMGAGPGRKFAKATARGRYGRVYAEPVPGEEVGYRVFVPVDVVFDLDFGVDSLRFEADVIAPIIVRLRLDEPLTLVWDLVPPTEDEVKLTLRSDRRRSEIIKRISGLEGELRRFLVRFIAREVEKPHVQRARRIELLPLVDAAWPALSSQFLPAEGIQRAG